MERKSGEILREKGLIIEQQLHWALFQQKYAPRQL